ncbi:hypothetical protein Sjap_004874 [Stephania japonica]|uniref:Pentatricopeptide repeat-containing protein n=1 Tax=Stephania japonica TaxID=461633 RepID=A0AAP0PLA8_9MAGN
MKLPLNQCRWFSSSSSPSTSLPWISPLHYIKPVTPKLNPPPETSTVQRRPKFITHEAALTMIKAERDPQRALQIFNMVSEQRGFNHNHATYSVILHKLAQSKKFKAVDALLRQMMSFETCKFHEGVFLNLMTHFAKSSHHERTLEMFFLIQPIVREKPSLKAVSTCLNLLLESGRLDLARKLLVESKRGFDLKPNSCIFNILVKHHMRNGDVDSAFEVVKEMRKCEGSYPNLITYSTLMGGLCEGGRLKDALQLFEEMVSKDQILPDVLTYNVLINGFCRAGKVDRARRIMDFMRKNGCQPNVFNYSTLMNGFRKEGRLDEAKEIFAEMRNSGLESDVVGYTTFINCLCRTSKVDEAMSVLREMKEKGCRADAVTISVILGALCRENRFEEALEMVDRLPYEGVRLNKACYRIVLNFLCKEEEMKKALYLLGLMLGRGFRPHFATSNQLLISLCNADRVEDAITALNGLIEMGFLPEDQSWLQLVESDKHSIRFIPFCKLYVHKVYFLGPALLAIPIVEACSLLVNISEHNSFHLLHELNQAAGYLHAKESICVTLNTLGDLIC